jgi:DNA-binding MarR family transcriptional regulator
MDGPAGCARVSGAQPEATCRRGTLSNRIIASEELPHREDAFCRALPRRYQGEQGRRRKEIQVNAKKPRVRQTGSLELRIWLRLLSCTSIISRHLRRNLKKSFSLTLPRFDLLAQVGRPRLGASLGELSRRLLVTKGNITDIVARLEAENLIERRRDDMDGRIQYVFLTETGNELLRKILPVHDKWLRDLLRGMSRQELGTLYEALGILTAALKKKERRERGHDDARDDDIAAGFGM